MPDLIHQTCPSCGGQLSFDAATQMVACPYCGSKFDVSDFAGKDTITGKDGWKLNSAAVWKDDGSSSVRLYVCKACGGEIITDITTAASSCPYCNNPVVMKEQFETAYPDGVIPFKTTRKQAIETLKKHITSRKFAHRAFKNENRLEEVKGVYVPYWFYSADVSADYEFTAEKVHTWSDRKYNYTETSHYRILRKTYLAFADIPADGSKKLDDAISESIEPFDVREAVPFESAYLAGFLADRYDVSWEEDLPVVDKRIRTSTEETVRSSIKNYTSVHKKKEDVNVTPGTVRYILCPVWLLNTKYRGKRYCFAMNGQTGLFVGDLPVDRCKFLVNWLITALLCTGGIFLALLLLMIA